MREGLTPPRANNQHDFAVVVLSKPLPDDINYMKISSNNSLPSDSVYARVAGYGIFEFESETNSQKRLYQVDVPIFQSQVCKEILENHFNDLLEIDTRLQVCTGYFNGGCNSCQGDYDGPLIQYDSQGLLILVAVLSFGVGCPRRGYRGVYTRSAQYVSFISQKSTDIFFFDDLRFVSTVNEVPSRPQGKPSSIPSLILTTLAAVVFLIAIACALFITCRLKRLSSKKANVDVNNPCTSAQQPTQSPPPQPQPPYAQYQQQQSEPYIYIYI